MLLLSRKRGEKIQILVPPCDSETSIEITMCEVRKVSARLGITAPVEVTICREEIHDKIQRQKSADLPPAA